MEPYDSLDSWSNYPPTFDPRGSSFIAPKGESSYNVIDLTSKVDGDNDCSLIKNEEDYAILENFRKNYEKKLLSEFGFSNTLYDSLQNEEKYKVSNNGISMIEENEVLRDENKVSNDGLSMFKENKEWMDVAPKNEENKVSNDYCLSTVKENKLVLWDIIAPKNEEKSKVSNYGLSKIEEDELLVWLDCVPETEENDVSNDSSSTFKEDELGWLDFAPQTEENKVSNDGLSTIIKANELGWLGNVPQNEENKVSNDGLSKENKVSRDYIAPKNKKKKVSFEDISPRNGNNNLIIHETNEIQENTLDQSNDELGFGKAKKKRYQPNNYASGTENLVNRPTKKCDHCQTESTPQWRRGPSYAKTLCNACGVQYKMRKILVSEYRPAASPSFDSTKHSNYHKRISKKQSMKEK